MPFYTKGMYSILEDNGISYDKENLIKILTPLGYTKTAKYYIDNFNLNQSVEQIVEKMEQRLVFEYSNNIKLKAGVKEFLKKIKEEGARLFVLTASPHVVTDICLKNNGVYELFEKVWSVEDFKSNKSDINLFYTVAKTIGCECADINYFEDNLEAVKNSVIAGYNTFGVKDVSSQTPDYTALVKSAAKNFVETFEELL
jgi:beta-phosphoglucomutase-like phosphatase (HAD superfamily)